MNKELIDFDPKNLPTLNDIVYLGDMANAGKEAQATLQNIVTNNNICTFLGSITGGDLAVMGAGGVLKDCGINVDTSQNITNVAKITAANVVCSSLTSGNVVFASTAGILTGKTPLAAFNTISPLTTKGDFIAFDGTNNVRVPAGTNGYLVAYDSTTSSGFTAVSPTSAAAFVDNAIFTSNAGQSITSASLTAINLAVLSQQSTGNTWSLNGDNTGMKCNKAGTYVFLGKIGIQVMSSTSANYGAVYGRFARNGTAHGEIIPINMLGPLNALAWLPVYDMITCAVNDVITLGVMSGTAPGTYSVVDPTAWASSGSSVTIIRIN